MVTEGDRSNEVARRRAHMPAGTGAITRGIAEAVGPHGRAVGVDVNPSMNTAFLQWRATAGMDNAIADHLSEMCAQAGLKEIIVTDQHETTRRTERDFETRAGVWTSVAATRGHQMVADRVISEAERRAAEDDYWIWLRDGGESHTMYLRAVEGVRA